MIFYGNELTYGLVVSGWLMGVGLGSFLGRNVDKNKLYLAFLTLALIIPISVFLIRLIPPVIGFGPGEIIGILPLFVVAFLILLPVYMNFGFIFALGLKKFSDYSGGGLKGITRPYIVDSIGDLSGGLAFSYIFVVFSSPIKNIFIISSISIIPVIFLKGKRYIVLLFLFILLFILPVSRNLMKLGYDNIYRGFKIERSIETRYGRYMEISRRGEYSLLNNGVLSSTYPEDILSEDIHIPILLSCGNVEEILYIGFPDPGYIRELLRYKNLTIVNPDPYAKKFLSGFLEKKFIGDLNFIDMDPRLFIRKTDVKFDAVFLEVGDPLNLTTNRFYSIEFASEISKVLNKNGILTFSISSGEDYLSGTVLDYNSTLYWTFGEQFKYNFLIPGYKMRFVFSDKPVLFSENTIKDGIKELGLKYLDIYTLKSKIPELRIKNIREQLNNNFVGLNMDRLPRAFILALTLWMEKQSNLSGIFKKIMDIPPVVLLLFLPIPILFRKTGFRVSLIGAMSMSIGYLCIISLQIIYGNVYHLVGMITGLFMFGVGIGTFLTEKIKIKKELKRPFLVTGIIFTFIIIINYLNPSSILGVFFISVLNMTAGFVVGWVYPVASLILGREFEVDSAAPAVYAYDVIGGGIGALLLSFIFLPVFGIIPTALLFTSFCIIGYFT